MCRAVRGVTNPMHSLSQKTMAWRRVCAWMSTVPVACRARSSSHEANGSLMPPAGGTPPDSGTRAGLTYVIARKPYRWSSGAATVHRLAHASSKHSATELGPGCTPSRTYRAMASDVTVRYPFSARYARYGSNRSGVTS